MQIRCKREIDAKAIADALNKLYPSYEHVPTKERGCRTWSIRVYSPPAPSKFRALIQTRAEI